MDSHSIDKENFVPSSPSFPSSPFLSRSLSHSFLDSAPASITKNVTVRSSRGLQSRPLNPNTNSDSLSSTPGAGLKHPGSTSKLAVQSIFKGRLNSLGLGGVQRVTQAERLKQELEINEEDEDDDDDAEPPASVSASVVRLPISASAPIARSLASQVLGDEFSSPKNNHKTPAKQSKTEANAQLSAAAIASPAVTRSVPAAAAASVTAPALAIGNPALAPPVQGPTPQPVSVQSLPSNPSVISSASVSVPDSRPLQSPALIRSALALKQQQIRSIPLSTPNPLPSQTQSHQSPPQKRFALSVKTPNHPSTAGHSSSPKAAISQTATKTPAKELANSQAATQPPPAAAPTPVKPSQGGQSSVSSSSSSSRSPSLSTVVVQGVQYYLLDKVGQGGSASVYRVLSSDKRVFALKIIDLKHEGTHITDYASEIALLERLKSASRVIQLLAHESTKNKQYLYMIFELGQIDFSQFLSRRQKSQIWFNPLEIRFYFYSMCKCVETLHEHEIIHLDLKPPNFVFVDGDLKIIDLGIAKEINAEVTSNVVSEQQVGTLNYMSPEMLEGQNTATTGNQQFKMGKASDIWSLGCILYQLVYGHSPFAKITNLIQKMRAITNPKHEIAFPSDSAQLAGGKVDLATVELLQRCLQRDAKSRPNIKEIFNFAFFSPTGAISPGSAMETG